MKNIIERFNSVNSLKHSLEQEIEDMGYSIQEYSNLLGEKIRISEELSSDDPDLLELKAKLENSSDKNSKDKKISNTKTNDVVTDEEKKKSDVDKKETKKNKEKSTDVKRKSDKKKKNKKGLSDKWYDLNEIHVYNGIGLKGELELYFKTVDELKAKLENRQRCLATLNNVLEKGLKEDMGCIAFRGSDDIVEISFLKSTGERQNFSLKSIYSGSAIPVENMIKIGV